MFFAAVIAHPADLADRVFDVAGADDDAVNRRTVIARQVQLNGAEHGYCAGSADNLDFPVFDRFADFIAFLKSFQQLVGAFHNRIVSQIGHVFVGKGFRNGHHSVRQGNIAFDKGFTAVGKPCQRNFGRTAADVKDERPFDAFFQKRQTADYRQTGFFLRGNDLQVKTCLALDFA